MRYYKIISKKLTHIDAGRYTFDNVRSFQRDKKTGAFYPCEYVPGALYTARELWNQFGISKENIQCFHFLQPVEISKNKTHFFFGLRFADNTPAFYDKNGNPIE